MSKISVTTIAGLTSGGDANKVIIESGDTLQVDSNATVGGTLGVTGVSTLSGNATVGGTLGVTGETTLATHLNLGDNDKIKLGASADLQIYHDGSHSYVQDNGTGNIRIKGANIEMVDNDDGGSLLQAVQGGAVQLFHNNSENIATSSSGVSVTGKIGINETSPAAGLHLTSTDNALSKIRLGYSTSNHYLEIGREAGYYRIASFENGQELTFGTSTTPGSTFERARFLGAGAHSGYFKVSDNSTYRDSTGAFHEVASSTSGQAATVFGMTHASYAGGGVQIIATRAATGGSYQFISAFSGNAADREYRIDSDGTVHADGSYSSSGGDYAEMFEWKDGNTSSEDRVGKTVVLDGNQIRLSTSDDAQATIIGVVSARPVILGDAHDEKWKDKYETDSYGRYVFEEYTQTEWTIEADKGAKEKKSYQTDMIPSDVTVPDDAIVTSKDENGDNFKRRKLNTAYDESKTYIPREDRKEFSAIGLVGKLRVNVGQTVGDRWIKMREISDTVHEYLVR